MTRYRLEITECPSKFQAEIQSIALQALKKFHGDNVAMWAAIYEAFPPDENTFVNALSISVATE